MCPTQEQVLLLLPARRLHQAVQQAQLLQQRRRRRQLYCKDDHGSRPVEAASSVSSGSSSWQALLCRHKDTLTTYLLTYTYLLTLLGCNSSSSASMFQVMCHPQCFCLSLCTHSKNGPWAPKQHIPSTTEGQKCYPESSAPVACQWTCFLCRSTA